MRVSIVGGGPGGLYLAILLARRGLAREITVYERNPVDATFGFGIVFSARTLDVLGAADAESQRAVLAQAVRWRDVVVTHRNEDVRIGGNAFVGVGRLAFLHALQRRCLELGVVLRTRHPIEDPRALVDASDLVVGADGVGSVVRQTWEAAFQPRLDERRNLYIWLGTAARFDGLGMIFRPFEGGVLIAHAYQYGPEGSTFVVECDPDTFTRSGLADLPAAPALERLGTAFRRELGGAPLVARGYRWIHFVMLENAHWSHDRVVLVGDALHTAHFSIGSGTKLALEDAIALVDALEGEARLADALSVYERARRPEVEKVQEASRNSLTWLEGIQADMPLDPVPLAYKMMTRSGRVDDDSLRRRDPAFAEAVARYRGVPRSPMP